MHPYSAEGVNFIVCDAAPLYGKPRRKSRAAQLVSFVRAGQKFRRHEHEFSIKQAPARTLPIHGTRVPHADLWRPGKTENRLSVCFEKRADMPLSTPVRSRARASSEYVYFNRERDAGYEFLSQRRSSRSISHAKQYLYVYVVRRIYDSCLFREGETQPADPPSQDDMRPMHIKRVFFSRPEISRSSRSNADSERELQMYGVLPKTKGWFSYLGGVFRQR